MSGKTLRTTAHAFSYIVLHAQDVHPLPYKTLVGGASRQERNHIYNTVYSVQMVNSENKNTVARHHYLHNLSRLWFGDAYTNWVSDQFDAIPKNKGYPQEYGPCVGDGLLCL